MKFVDLDAQFKALEGEIRAAIDRVLEHKQFIMGPEVAALESELAAYCGANHVITAASGTDALLMALMVHGVGPGDGIIAPPFTFVATAEVVQLLGATTVFVDVQEDSFNMDCAALEATIAKIKADRTVRLRGIIAVDLFGQPADYAEIAALAEQHGLFVVSDAAQSFGAEYRGARVGSIGEITTTSFFPAKPLGCYGDGGAVFAHDAATAALLESIRFHGKGVTQYENLRIGITGRLDTIQAAVLRCKLKVFDSELATRQRIADTYTTELESVVRVPRILPDRKSAWTAYTIRSPQRERIRTALTDNQIPSAVYYPLPLHRQPAFKEAIGGGEPMPVADRLAQEVISLPVHPYLSEQEQARIIKCVRDAVA